MDIDYLLTATRSARKSLDLAAPVDRDEIRDCLRIALQAANGSNQQPWRWLVVCDADLRTEIARSVPGCLPLPNGTTDGERPAALRDVRSDASCRRPSGSSSTWRKCRRSSFPATSPTSRAPETTTRSSRRRCTDRSSRRSGTFSSRSTRAATAPASRPCTFSANRKCGQLLGIPDTYVQGCLLPVARLRAGKHFQPAPRRPIEEVVAVDGWDGPPL